MDPDRLNLVRAFVTWTLRAVALLMVVIGSALCLNRLLFGILVGAGGSFYESTFVVWMESRTTHPIYRGIPLVILGVALAFLSRRLSRWIITVPDDVCPRCGYSRPIADPPSINDSTPATSTHRSTRCPECGLEGFLKNEKD